MDDMSWWKRTFWLGAVLLTSVCLGLLPAGLLSAGTAASASPRGRLARVLSVNDTGRLHVANPNSNGETLIEEGRATGSLPGSVRASLKLGTSTVRVGFTIYLPGGTITGHGITSFNPGKGEYASFGGSISVNHGGGRYAHASGTGRVYGTINRNTDNATVQVIGQLHV
jgi:hypothetical protein